MELTTPQKLHWSELLTPGGSDTKLTSLVPHTEVLHVSVKTTFEEGAGVRRRGRCRSGSVHHARYCSGEAADHATGFCAGDFCRPCCHVSVDDVDPPERGRYLEAPSRG